MPRCIGTTLANKPCKKSAMKNVEYCHCHFKPDFECPICYEQVYKTFDTGCHTFCKSCIIKWYFTGATTCPMCRVEIDFAQLYIR